MICGVATVGAYRDNDRTKEGADDDLLMNMLYEVP